MIVKFKGHKFKTGDRQFHGNITINNALMMSYNIPAVKAYQEVGFNRVKEYASKVGMSVTDDSLTTPIGGSSDGYSPLQMAAAMYHLVIMDIMLLQKQLKKYMIMKEKKLKALVLMIENKS